MAREHHCPNCGAQACNASTSKIHTCGVCAAIWEEDLSAPVPAPTPPRPATPVPAPTPAAPVARPATAPPPAPPPKPALQPTPGNPAPAATATARPIIPPGPPAAPMAAPADGSGLRPAPAIVSPAATPKPTPVAAPKQLPAGPSAGPGPAAPTSSGGEKTMAEVLQGAQVKRCPSCESEGVAQPSDFAMIQGRLVLVDSQTYRAHRWYADTGELLPAPGAASPAPPAAAPAARANPTT